MVFSPHIRSGRKGHFLKDTHIYKVNDCHQFPFSQQTKRSRDALAAWTQHCSLHFQPWPVCLCLWKWITDATLLRQNCYFWTFTQHPVLGLQRLTWKNGLLLMCYWAQSMRSTHGISESRSMWLWLILIPLALSGHHSLVHHFIKSQNSYWVTTSNDLQDGQPFFPLSRKQSIGSVTSGAQSIPVAFPARSFVNDLLFY